MSASIVSQQIAVKMGSNKILLDVNNDELKSMTSVELIRKVLRKLSLNERLAKTYAVFESVRGVERLLDNKESIFNICAQVFDVQFVVRKCYRMEKKLVKQNEKHKSSLSKKCFKKLRMQGVSDENSRQLNYVPTEIEKEYLKQLFDNETKLNEQVVSAEKIEAKQAAQQTVKLCNFHQNQLANNLNEKLAHNVKFLQALYLKMRKQSEAKSSKNFFLSNKYEKLKESNSCGSSEESDECERRKISSSTSTLESLV